MASAGNVYLLRHGTSQWYKIGRTINTAAKRICTGLATGNPEGLREVASWYCESRHGHFECYLHALFSKYHLHGRAATEFFDFTDVYNETALVDLITQQHNAFVADLIEEPTMEMETEECVPSMEHVDLLLQERRELAANVKMSEIRLKTIDVLLKHYIGKHGGLMDADNRPVISWKPQRRQVLDTAALRKAHPELAEAFTKTTETRIFRYL